MASPYRLSIRAELQSENGLDRIHESLAQSWSCGPGVSLSPGLPGKLLVAGSHCTGGVRHLASPDPRFESWEWVFKSLKGSSDSSFACFEFLTTLCLHAEYFQVFHLRKHQGWVSWLFDRFNC